MFLWIRPILTELHEVDPCFRMSGLWSPMVLDASESCDLSKHPGEALQLVKLIRSWKWPCYDWPKSTEFTPNAWAVAHGFKCFHCRPWATKWVYFSWCSGQVQTLRLWSTEAGSSRPKYPGRSPWFSPWRMSSHVFAHCDVICSRPGERVEDWVLNLRVLSPPSPAAGEHATGSTSARDWTQLHVPARLW